MGIGNEEEVKARKGIRRFKKNGHERKTKRVLTAVITSSATQRSWLDIKERKGRKDDDEKKRRTQWSKGEADVFVQK